MSVWFWKILGYNRALQGDTFAIAGDSIHLSLQYLITVSIYMQVYFPSMSVRSDSIHLSLQYLITVSIYMQVYFQVCQSDLTRYIYHCNISSLFLSTCRYTSKYVSPIWLDTFITAISHHCFYLHAGILPSMSVRSDSIHLSLQYLITVSIYMQVYIQVCQSDPG